jgi:hypothetical protein
MGNRSEPIDWSKAGTRLRRTPQTPAHGGRNPDWNWVAKRWKTAEEYAGEEIGPLEVVTLADCPICDQPKHRVCRDARGNSMADGPHNERRVAAGAARIASGEFSLQQAQPPRNSATGQPMSPREAFESGCG